MSEDFGAQVERIAALGEPVRRELYRYVLSQDGPVGREQAAAGAGVAHHVAKFHLDKLVADGLLEVEYARPPGRTGPGAGRPAKLYRRSARDIAVSLPERHYDLAGRVMAAAITATAHDGIPLAGALRAAAETAGRDLGAETSGAAAEPADRIAAASNVLARNGYEPRATADGLTLANCPFHSLAQAYPDLICGLNVHLVGGLLDALGAADLCARLGPAPGRCCVTVRKA
jgi:predicted ArsR family transcriptional regulator